MADLMDSLQHNPMHPPPLDSTASMTRRGSEASPSRSSFQSSNASRIHTPSTSIPSTPIMPTKPSSPEKRPLYPGESDNFLTAVATQERRVLELKEELQKAEMDLGKLKKQWAAHEAKKKRNEARNSEQLQPLKTSFPEYTTIREESPVSASRELDRQKSLSSSARSSQRKVFSGSRHTRTLSLLSTNNSKAELQYPPRGDSLTTKSKTSPETVEAIPELTIPETPSKSIKDPSKNSDRDVIIETGKQLVGDFRQGFWTFVEDLKQVTVGDESSPVGETRISPKGNLLGSKKVLEKNREVLIEDSATSKDHKQEDVHTGRNGETMKSNHASKLIVENGDQISLKGADRPQQGLGISMDSDNEAWDNWDMNRPSDSVPSQDRKTD